MSVDHALRKLAEWCTAVDGQGNSRGEKNPSRPDGILARFQSQFEAIVATQTKIGEAVSSTLGDVLSLALGTQKW